MQCPKCGQQNPANVSFCKSCGHNLAQAPAPGAPPPFAPGPQPPLPGAGAPPTAQVGPQPMSPGPGPYPYYPPPQQPGGQAWGNPYQQPYGPPPSVAPMGPVGQSPFNIWGPFAGYGTRGRHVAWLLGAMGDRADVLRNAISMRFAARTIVDAVASDKILVGQGLVVEQRPYFLIQRKVATVGLYLARLGDDIYISQVTYARCPLSVARSVLLAVMLIFQVFFLFGGSGSLLNSFSTSSLLGFGDGPDMGALAFFLCCIGPLGLINTMALLAAGLFTVWRTVTDKDPLAVLRTTLNEFNLDDVVGLEKAVEETVRECMDQIGIDRRLMPPAADSSMRPRVI
jgi:hypothetical protein